MQYNMLKGKIHRAVVKQADLNYVGSIIKWLTMNALISRHQSL